MLRATAVGTASECAGRGEAPSGRAVLQHDQRHLRRRRLDLEDGRALLVDLAETVVLGGGDVLLLEGGGFIEIIAAEEALYEITGRDPVHMTELAWHIGNRHLPASIGQTRILILRDHVIKAMLEGLGAQVREITAPFNPARGAYSGHISGGHGAQGHYYEFGAHRHG